MAGKRVLFLVNKDNVVYNFRKELVFALLDAGYEVYISSPYGNKIDYLTAVGAKFMPLEIDRRGKNIVKDIKLIRDYYKLIKNLKPDVVLTYTTKCSTYGGLVCRVLKTPYIINNAGMYRIEDLNKFIWGVLKLLYKLSYSHAACLMYQNSYERDTLNAIIGHRAHYIDIPGSGVNLNEFELTEYPKDDGYITFNYVARIAKFKGIDEFLACAKIIRKKYTHVRFILYGDFDDDEYRLYIRELEAQGIVKYGGVQLDMRPYIANANAVIHPSYYEGITNVILEHGAMGRPAIASDIPGCREGIDEGKSGYLFPLKDVDALCKIVENFILLPYKKKKDMGRAARMKMEQEFDRNIVTNIYLKEIEKILNKQNS